jgi:hypothetical protein
MRCVVDEMGGDTERRCKEDRWEPDGLLTRPRTVGMRQTYVVGVMAVGILVVASCGDPEIVDGPVGAPQPSSAPPATRLMEPPPEPGDGDFVPVTALDAGTVDDPCPTDVAVDMSATEPSVMLDETSRLEPLLGIVLQYGQQYPDEFGGYGLHWLSAGDASVFVSFTDNVADHRAALIERVEFPDELIVCQAPASETDRSAIQATLTNELAGRYTSIGSGGVAGAVTVDLNPDEEDLAAELVRRYGAAVDVTVGALKYPLGEAEAVCRPPLEPSLIDGLTITIVDPDTPKNITGSGTMTLTVRLTNTTDQTVRFDSGQPSAVITDAEGMPRTLDTIGVGDVGILIEVEPGGHQDFDLDVSLASCDPALGYILPPGDHHVVISLYNGRLQTDMNSDPLRVVISS